jgi:hypothetical protein
MSDKEQKAELRELAETRLKAWAVGEYSNAWNHLRAEFKLEQVLQQATGVLEQARLTNPSGIQSSTTDLILGRIVQDGGLGWLRVGSDGSPQFEPAKTKVEVE